MISTSTSLRSCCLALVGMATTLATSAVAAPRYVATIMQEPGAVSVVPRDIDDKGRITGFVYFGNGEPVSRQPFFWQDGALSLVPVDPGDTRGECLASDGMAFGIDVTKGNLVHLSPDGSTPIVNADVLTGTQIIKTTPSGYVAGNFSWFVHGFIWHPKTGLEQLSQVGDDDAVRIRDINDAGIAVGTVYFDNGSHRAFYHRPGEEIVVLTPGLFGITHSMGIDDDNRILLFHYDGTRLFLRYAHLGSTGITLDPQLLSMHTNEFNTIDCRTNDAGDITVAWTHMGEAFVKVMPAGSDKFIEMSVTGNFLDVELDGVTESGEHYGRFFDNNYDSHVFVATAKDGLTMLKHRMIGQQPMFWDALARDMNTSGQMLVQIGEENSYGDWAMIEPARPGDADGDGAVDVNDVLLVVDAWGPRSLEAICGPDMNMNGDVDVYDLLEVLKHYDQ